MKKLKIGILIDQLVSGGVQKSAIQEAIHLQDLGHDITMFVLFRLQNEFQFQDLAKELKIIYLSDFNPIFFHKAIPIPYFGFLTHLHLLNPLFSARYKFIKNFDFLISHGTTTCITAATISRFYKIPYMAFVYDPMLYILDKVYSKTNLRHLFFLIKPITRFYEKSFLLSAALVATLSKVHQDFIKRTYHIDPIIIYPGYKLIKNIPKKTDKYILGFTRWELAKNPYIFIWLAKKIPKVKFLIAGTWSKPEEEKQFKKIIYTQRLTDRIKILSPIDENKLKLIAAASIIWIHPHFEAFSMSGLEMAALGLPIIIPQGSGVTELFKNGVHGFFPKQGDKIELLNSVKYLLTHPQKAKQMGLEAAKIAQHYSWKKHAQSMSNVITDNIGKKKIICLSNAFVTESSAGGGDHFLIELIKKLPKDMHATIIMPRIGLTHWQNLNLISDQIRYLILPSNPFDNIDLPIPLFFAYLIRSFQTYRLLKRLPNFQLMHTATDLLPDVLPAYFYKISSPHISWAARFFHFIESPKTRPGKFLVNLGSYLLQQKSIQLINNANLVLVDNQNLVLSLSKKGIKFNKIKVSPGGVNIVDIPKKVFSKKEHFNTIFVGRLLPHKGTYDSLEVWRKVTGIFPKAKLTVLGYGPAYEVQKLNDMIKKFHLQKNVLLTGYISDRNLINKYYRNAHLLLFLDHEAGFGLVVAEAMALGIPVMAYNLPIFGTVYKKGYITSQLQNTSEVAQNIINLMKNQQVYKKLSDQAKTEAKKFTWDLAGNRFYSILKTLI